MIIIYLFECEQYSKIDGLNKKCKRTNKINKTIVPEIQRMDTNFGNDYI